MAAFTREIFSRGKTPAVFGPLERDAVIGWGRDWIFLQSDSTDGATKAIN